MTSRSLRAILQSLPMLAVCTTLIATASALLTAYFYGLGRQHGWDVTGFVLGTLAMAASLVLVASLVALGRLWWSRPIAVLLALPLGTAHGYLWATLAWRWFEPVLANFTVPLTLPWMVGSVCGLVMAVLLPILLPHKLMTNTITIVGASTILLAIFGPGLLLASCMLALLLDDGVVLSTSLSPDNRVTALVIGDDCGATCSCQLRVDLKSDRRYVREVYRSDACDAQVNWQSATEFRIRDNEGGEKQLDIRVFGLQP